MDRTQLQHDLKHYIVETLLDGRPPVELTPETALVESWILDSINIMKLVGHIEKTYSVRVPEDAINLQNFAHLDAITDLVVSCLR